MKIWYWGTNLSYHLSPSITQLGVLLSTGRVAKICQLCMSIIFIMDNCIYSYWTELCINNRNGIYNCCPNSTIEPLTTKQFVTSPPPRRGVKYLSVCLSVYLHNSKTTRPNFTKVLGMLPVARSSSDSVAIHCVFPVLWMMSCFYTTGPINRIKHGVMFRRVHQMALPVGRQTTTAFSWVCQSVAWGKVCYQQLPCLHLFLLLNMTLSDNYTY